MKTQVFELEILASHFKIGIFHKTNLVYYLVTQVFKDGAYKEEKNPKKNQLRCQSRFQGLIFVKTIGKQQAVIQEQELL